MPHISVTYSYPPAYSFHMLPHASYLSHIQLPSSLQLPYAPPCLISQSHTVTLQPTASICSSMPHISVTYSYPPAYSFHMLLHASYLSHIQLPSILQLPYAPPCLILYPSHRQLPSSLQLPYPPPCLILDLSDIQVPSSLQLPYAPPCLISQSHTVTLQPTASICSSMPHISVTYRYTPAYSFHMLLHASYLSHIQLPSSLQLPYAPPCLISQSHTVTLQPTASICSSMPHISVTYSCPPAYRFHILLHVSYLSDIQVHSSLQLPYPPPCLISQ